MMTKRCEFCKKTYVRKHTCKYSVRKNTNKITNFLALLCFNHFQHSTGCGRKRDFNINEFVKSRHYNLFFSLAQYITLMNLNYENYLNFLFRYKIPSCKWQNDDIHSQYQVCFNKENDIRTGIRNFLALKKRWAFNNNDNAKNYWVEENPSTILNHFQDGRIHPSILIISKNAQQFLQMLPTDRIVALYKSLNIEVYLSKIEQIYITEYNDI